MLWLAALWLLQPVLAANPITFCKCFCGANSTVLSLENLSPENLTKPCSVCTKQYCLDNVEGGMCDGIRDAVCPSTDFRTTCFARDSLKDELIIYFFLTMTLGLLAIAVLGPYINDVWRKQRPRFTYSSMPTAPYAH